IGPDPRNFNQRVSLGRNDLLIRTFLKLLNDCFNLENTSLRRVSKESLMEKLLVELGRYLPLRDVLATRLSSQDDIQLAKKSLAIMCADNYPFSIFWKWHILKDVQLRQRFPDLRVELGF
ncbi:hypothetical protein POU90_23555, partial [Klebsiella pneumoniae]